MVFLNPRSPSDEVTLSTRGDPLQLTSVDGGHLVAFVQREGNHQDLRIASVTGVSLFTLPFSSQELFLRRQGRTLFLGVDQTLLRFEVRAQ